MTPGTSRAHNGRMGLFQQRPEEPTEWGGLPSEPLQPRSAAEQLGDAPPIDLDLPLLDELPGTETIAVAVVSVDLSADAE